MKESHHTTNGAIGGVWNLARISMQFVGRRTAQNWAALRSLGTMAQILQCVESSGGNPSHLHCYCTGLPGQACRPLVVRMDGSTTLHSLAASCLQLEDAL